MEESKSSVWNRIFTGFAIFGMFTALVLLGFVTPNLIFSNSSMGIERFGWKFVAVPGDWQIQTAPKYIVDSIISESQNIIELDVVFVSQKNLLAADKSKIDLLYRQIEDSLKNEETFVSGLPNGCITEYHDNDLVALVFEYYFECECAFKNGMNVFYVSIDLSDPGTPSIHSTVICEGIPRTGHPTTKPKGGA